MLPLVVQNVHIDRESVVRDCLRRCKAGIEKKESTEEALKCWNLENILHAELAGKKKPEEWTLEDMIIEEHGSPLSSDDVVIVN